jgi:hypothetical protein
LPRISAFYGIVIAMYYSDHAPPHFHAIYGGHEAKVRIEDGILIAGFLPPRAAKLVSEWRSLHHTQLQANWELAREGLPLDTIDPLT